MDIIPGRDNNQAQPERTASAKTEPEEKVIERPSVRRHSEPTRHLKPERKRFKIIAAIVGILLIVAVIVLGVLFFYNSSTGSTIDGSKYQAVFLADNNGQVYFGKLHVLNGDYMKLTDIWYIQSKNTTSTNPQETENKSKPSAELIKLGNEIHGPVDEMIISKDKILFFENLKNDSRVSKLIAENQSKK